MRLVLSINRDIVLESRIASRNHNVSEIHVEVVHRAEQHPWNVDVQKFSFKIIKEISIKIVAQ